MQNYNSKLKIIKYPDPILREKSQEIKEITEEIKNLGQDMIKTMIMKDGAGLAGPQVGAAKRIIAVQTEKGPEVFINPKIVERSKETETGEEGCLSFPGLFLKIKRARRVELEALDINGEKIKIKTEGLPARIFQHEVDHLDGILFIDRVRVGRRIWELLKFYSKIRR